MKKVSASKKPYTLKTLASGLRIMTIPMKNPTATVLVLVEAGSKYESLHENGISHFLEHMCFKGTTNRPRVSDISLELDTLGASYNAFTGQEYTGYYAKGRSTQVYKLLDIVSDLYINPTLPKEEIEKEKGVICDEINMYEDTPARKVYTLFEELLYGDQPAGRTISGTKERVKSFTRKDIVAYRAKHYVPEKTLIVVAGDIDEKSIQKEVEKNFKKLSSSKRDEKAQKLKVKQNQKEPQLKVHYKKTDQTHILIGFRGYDIFHPDSKVVGSIGGVLGAGMSSRLFKKIRDEMGVGYYVGAYNDTATDTGVLVLRAGVSPERAAEVVKAMLEECKRFCLEDVGEAELKKLNEIISGSLFMGLESSDAIAEYFGMQAILHKDIKTAEETEREFRAVRPEDLRRIAQKIFVPKNLSICILGPHKNAKEFEKILKEF